MKRFIYKSLTGTSSIRPEDDYRAILIAGSVTNRYPTVGLVDPDGNRKYIAIHRLVADAFIPHTTKNNVVNHIDNNPTDNNINNLKWTTYSGNIKHAASVGRMAKRLTKDDVGIIYILLFKGKKTKAHSSVV